MTMGTFLVTFAGAATLSSLMMRLVHWLDHPTRRRASATR